MVLDKAFNKSLPKDDRKTILLLYIGLRNTFALLQAIKYTPVLAIEKLTNYKDIDNIIVYTHLLHKMATKVIFKGLV